MDFDEKKKAEELLKSARKNSFWGGMVAGAAIMLFILLFFTSIRLLLRSFRAPQAPVQNEVQVNVNESESFVNDELIRKLAEAERIIDGVYYFDVPDNKTIADYAMLGVMASLGDVYADYFSVEDLQEKLNEDDGIYYGIGCSVITNADTSLQEVVTVYTNSPAERAGVQEGDLIYAVDGESVYGLNQTDTVDKVKGPEDTKVLITFIRGDEYIDIEVIRGKVEYHLVDSEMFDSEIGYIRLESFEGAAVSQFEEALKELKTQGMKSLIIDLRNNGGGTLDSVLDIAETFMPKGLMTYLETKDGTRREYNCKGKNKIDVPIVMLVNGYTASASELLTGAVRDYEMGKVVGTTTYGKGIAQGTYILSDGSAIKLTTEGYFTPLGKSVHKVGIVPDYVVEFDSEAYYAEESVDNQLEKAKEVAKGLIK